MIVYDCEIVKGILKDREPSVEGVEYVSKRGPEAWRCFDEMGISVIGAYEFESDRYRVFCQDNFGEFQKLVDDASLVIGFNSLSFDNRLCEANGITVPDGKSYDLLVEIWKASGLSEKFVYPSHVGFSLDQCCALNLRSTKTGHGAMAPVDWQQGRIGSVIDYCLNDVWLTAALTREIINKGGIWSPKQAGKFLQIPAPKLQVTY